MRVCKKKIQKQKKLHTHMKREFKLNFDLSEKKKKNLHLDHKTGIL